MRLFFVFFLLCFVNVFGSDFSEYDELLDINQIAPQEPKEDRALLKKAFIDWGNLELRAELREKFKVAHEKDFVLQAFSQKDIEETKFKNLLYQLIYTIQVDSEYTLGDILSISPRFFVTMMNDIHSQMMLEMSHFINTDLVLKAKLKFTGMSKLIDLFLNSEFYEKRSPLKPVNSSYVPQRYHSVVIEARGLNLKPSLFPEIYSYDENGKEISIFSVMQAYRQDVVQKGMVKYYKDSRMLKKTKDRIYRATALESRGRYLSDIIISREDYLKIFNSKETLEALKKGNLIILI